VYHRNDESLERIHRDARVHLGEKTTRSSPSIPALSSGCSESASIANSNAARWATDEARAPDGAANLSASISSGALASPVASTSYLRRSASHATPCQNPALPRARYRWNPALFDRCFQYRPRPPRTPSWIAGPSFTTRRSGFRRIGEPTAFCRSSAGLSARSMMMVLCVAGRILVARRR
jgi:hypothetical protein